MDFRAPGWLCTVCQTGNNSLRKQSLCYHATWEGFSLHVKVSNEQLCEGHNLHYSDCPLQEALVWLTSFSMCIISAEVGWISVILSHCSLGILVYISVLAGKQYSWFFHVRTEKTISNQARNKALAFQSMGETISRGSSPSLAAQGMLFAIYLLLNPFQVLLVQSVEFETDLSCPHWEKRTSPFPLHHHVPQPLEPQITEAKCRMPPCDFWPLKTFLEKSVFSVGQF